MYTHTQTDTHPHAHTHTQHAHNTRTRARTHTHTYIHTHTYTHTHAYTHTYRLGVGDVVLVTNVVVFSVGDVTDSRHPLDRYVCMYVRACMFVCDMNVWMYVCTHIYMCVRVFSGVYVIECV